MLLQLNITNFALIEKLSISFNEGFNVFSGETGAGKSIIIDAINFVLGGKFNRDLIRTGETKTYVEAVFTIDNHKTKEVLKELEIEYDDIVIISRETFSTGRSIIKVNGKSIIVSTLKALSETLLDIHGQHENQNLLDGSKHIDYLDNFIGTSIEEKLNRYSLLFKELNEIKERIFKLQGNDGERDKIVNYLKYQIEEINAAKLRPEEDKELQERYQILTHAEKISSVLNMSYNILNNGGDSGVSVFDGLGSIIKELRGIEKHIDAVKEISNSLEEAYYNIEQNISEIRNLKDSVYYDNDELAAINNRMYLIGSYKKKYGNTIDEILQYRDRIQKEYEELINSEEIVNSLKQEQSQLEKKIRFLAQEMHDIRVKSAELLEKKVKEELSYIGLEKSIFKINVEKEDKITTKGFDKVTFMISANPGEPLKPLEKVASGGELSRIMLALKTVFVDKDMIPTVIFDEIDVGISGRIAQRVAEKMFVISIKHQVLCVTHLPQIAAMSEEHFLVYKDVKEEKTYTGVKNLPQDEKEYEIARMIGGAEVTKVTLDNAREIINMGNYIKKDIRDKKAI
jgi:DNA repair protein RecN (Recombination protein N)